MTSKISSISKSAPLYWWCIASIIIVFLLYLQYGYQIGIEDGPEFLTFSKIAQNPSLYKNDLFMQSMLDMGWNERTLFGHFFALFPNLEWAGWIAHFLLTTMMVIGVQVCAYKLLQNFLWSTMATALSLLIVNNLEIGGNMLYFNDIQGESFANTIGIWVFAAWLYNKKPLGIILLIIATWFHPLIGFQLFLIFSGSYILFSLYQKKFENLKAMLLATLAYLTFAGWLIVYIFIGHKSGQEMASTEEFMELSYKFSLMCHFTPHVFSRKGYIFLSMCLIAGIYYFNKKNKEVLALLIVLLIGYIIYTIGYYANSYLITSTWWFRTNMWTKFIGTLALCALIQECSKGLSQQIIPFVIFTISIIMSFLFISQTKYLFPWNDLRKQSDEIDLSIAAKGLTKQDAVFIQPFFFTALKYFGERASYVEYHRIVRSRATIKIWYARLGELYQLDKSINVARNPDLFETMDKNYAGLNTVALEQLKQKGVQYMITFSYCNYPQYKTIYQNKSYKLLKL